MIDNEKAIKLNGYDERRAEIVSRLCDYNDKDLFSICHDAFCYDGSFDFCDAFNAEDIDDFLCSMTPYDIMCRIVFGNVENVNDMLRFDAYGNLESVTEWDLHDEARDNIEEIADWLMDNYSNTSSLYSDDDELFETWEDIDNGYYDDEDEDEE